MNGKASEFGHTKGCLQPPQLDFKFVHTDMGVHLHRETSQFDPLEEGK